MLSLSLSKPTSPVCVHLTAQHVSRGKQIIIRVRITTGWRNPAQNNKQSKHWLLTYVSMSESGSM